MITEEYNEYISNIRRTEYSHLALIKKCSGEILSAEYKNLISDIKKLDKIIHELNPIGAIIARTPNDSLIQYTPEMLLTIDANMLKVKSSIQLLTKNTEDLLVKL